MIEAYLGGDVALNLGPDVNRDLPEGRCSPLDKLAVAYGGIQAVKGIDLHVEQASSSA